LPLKGSGGLYFYLQAAQGYRMTNHPLGGLPGLMLGRNLKDCEKGTHSACKATVLGDQIF